MCFLAVFTLALDKMCSGSLPGVNCGRVVLLIAHTLLVPRLRKSRGILLSTLSATLYL